MKCTYTTYLAAALAVTGAVALPSPKYLAMKGINPHRPVKPKSSDIVAELRAVQLAADLKAKPANASSSEAAPTVKAPYENVWASLTPAEAASVVKLLHSMDDFNLTAAEDAGS